MAEEGSGDRKVAALLVLVTAGDEEVAESIASALVDERLAACVNIVRNVRSVYRWKGNVEKDDELLLLIKTTQDRFEYLKRKVLELHTYDVPEVIALSIDEGHAPYLEWLFAESRENL